MLKKLILSVVFTCISMSLWAQAIPAIVINDAPGGCGAVGYDETDLENPYYPYKLIPSETGKRLVATFEGNTLILKCRVDGVPNTTGRAIVDIWDWIYRDFGIRFACSTMFEGVRYFTFDAHTTLTPNGVEHTTCRFELP